jgi:hypothetical protein
MPILSLEEFAEKRSGDRSPMLDFYWYCVELPFDLDPSYVETVTLPIPSINMKPVFMAGRFAQYPGFRELSAFDITFYEDVSMRSFKYVDDWRNRVMHPTEGYYYLPGNYKRNMKFALTDGRTTDSPIMTVSLEDVWPTTTSPIGLVNNGGQAIKIQQNFAIDRVTYE